MEKSLLSLLSIIPIQQYEITLYLLEKKGGFLDYVPDGVKIAEAKWYKGIKSIVMQPPQHTARDYAHRRRYFKLFSFLWAYVVSQKTGNRFVFYKHVFKSVPYHDETYDLAVSYQGPTDLIDYYIANRVQAKEKISWVHFDVSKHHINVPLYSTLYRKYKRVMVVSEAAKQQLHRRIPGVAGKTQVFPNVVPYRFIQQMAKEAVPFDDHYDGLRIVTVGRLSPEKGQDVAIEVLYRLRQEGQEVKWYCIGEGKSRQDYEQRIERYGLNAHFMLLGAKTNPYPYMAKADVYVQTSRHEGFCLTLAEAKCLNKPIVTTNFIGAYEQIDHGRTGYIVQCDATELYGAIRYLLDRKSERTRLTENLRNDNERKGVNAFERSNQEAAHAF